MKALALGTILLCGALAACSSDGGSTGTGTGGSGDGGGAGEGGSDGDGGSTSTPTSSGNTTTGTPTTTTTGSPTTTTTGSGDCSVDPQIPDAVCNECVMGQCCAELEACFNQTVVCFDADGALDPESEGGAAYLACAETGCADECAGGTGGICDSGLSLGEGQEEADACLGEACCDEFSACTSDGADVQACIDCFNSEAGGPLCDPAIACADTSGCFSDICDTGIGFGDATIDDCLSDACCTEYETCVGDGSDASVQACLDCLNSEAGGPLCDDAITCTNESGCVPEQ